MGKALIIKGADFSVNAIEVITPPTPGPEPGPGPEPSANIVFVDNAVKTICANNWGYGGELTYAQAAEVTSLAQKFRNNANITSFDELQYFTGLTSLNQYEFANCSQLTSVVIPSNITTINSGAFNGSAVASIGSQTTGVTTIGENNFWNGPLAGVILLPAITTIGASVFRNTQITKIDLGPNLTSIGNFCFSGAGAVTVILRATTPPTIPAANAFDNTAIFYVPYSADHSVLNTYKSAAYWSSHASRIYELDEDGNIPSA